MQERTAEKDYDCTKCRHRDGCPRFQEGSWCTRYATREPRERGTGPAEKWARGDEETGLE